MKILLRIFLCAGLLATFSVWTAAQSVGNSEAASKYDAAKDETKVEITNVKIVSDLNKEAYVNISATFKGQKMTAEPEDVTFIISTISTGNYKYPAMNMMKVVAEKSKLSDMLMLNLDKRKIGDDFLETLGTRIKIDIFKKFADLKTVKLQFGNATFEIGEEQMSKIRSFKTKIIL